MAAPTYAHGTGAAATLAAMTGHGSGDDGSVDHLARAGVAELHGRVSNLESAAGDPAATDDTGTADTDS
jgi:hypothetical protein